MARATLTFLATWAALASSLFVGVLGRVSFLGGIMGVALLHEWCCQRLGSNTHRRTVRWTQTLGMQVRAQVHDKTNGGEL